MLSQTKPAWRALFVVLVLCAALSAQTVALRAEHETHSASEHCCPLCHMGPAPVLPSITPAVTAPLVSSVRLESPAETARVSETFRAPVSSRAPPA